MDERVEEIREWVGKERMRHREQHIEMNSCCTIVDEHVPYLFDRLQAAEERVRELEKELRRTGCFCGPVDEPDPMEHREDCAYRVAMERIAAREALREGEG